MVSIKRGFSWRANIELNFAWSGLSNIGLVTPLGVGTERVWNNLLEGKCGITQINSEGIN